MNAFETFLASLGPFHFVTAAQLPDLVRLHRLCQCLVRCGACRFSCAAQDVPHLLKCIDAGGDYVRDVAIVPAEVEAAPNWRPEPLPLTTLAAALRPAMAPRPPADLAATVRRRELRLGHRLISDFNEADCGGVFDGFRVTSDADPGL